MYVVTPLDTEYSGVAIIDCLSKPERRAYGDSDKLYALIRSFYRGLAVPRYECNDEYRYYEVLRELTGHAEAGDSYLVHLECHASPQGISVGDADFVPWAKQLPLLAALNRAMGGTLVLDLSACNGIYASLTAALDPGGEVPFYGVIAPAKEVDMACAATVTAAFYRRYLAGQPLDHAVRDANGDLGYPVLNSIRAEVIRRELGKGYAFRPNAADDDVLECTPEGKVRVRAR